ncbi:MAG TPA: nuclear transport factor 2 family protein [Fluviicoccus sp.]|nr:nuclear transport factor 2 family protein [Fluviicoccus sp.]
MSDLAAIEAVVHTYFQALHHGNADLISTVFLPQAGIFGYYEGEQVTIDLHVYLNILRHQSPPVLLGEDFDMQISGIDLIGRVAAVRTRYLFQALRYTEFLSLLQVDGVWKIVSKTFHHDPD